MLVLRLLFNNEPSFFILFCRSNLIQNPCCLVQPVRLKRSYLRCSVTTLRRRYYFYEKKFFATGYQATELIPPPKVTRNNEASYSCEVRERLSSR